MKGVITDIKSEQAGTSADIKGIENEKMDKTTVYQYVATELGNIELKTANAVNNEMGIMEGKVKAEIDKINNKNGSKSQRKKTEKIEKRPQR